MKTYKIKYILSLGLMIFPFITFGAFENVISLMNIFGGLINTSIRILFGLSLVFFFWGIVQFIQNAGNEKTREEGKKKMLWGIIAIFVFLSIYGIIAFIGDTLGVEQTPAPLWQGDAIPGGGGTNI